MKTTLQNLRARIFVLLTLIGITSFAQQGINYQGIARDVNSDLLVNTNITLDINIIKTTSGGTAVYSETHNTMTDANGVFSVVIGEGSSITPFADINWAEDKHFFNVWLDGIEIGTTEFQSVPYTQAMGKWQASKNGLETKNTGRSIYIGENAGENDDNTDNQNIGIGDKTLESTTTGSLNIALGSSSLNKNIDGQSNIAIGSFALYDNTSGSYNTAVGSSALNYNTTGYDNCAFGAGALYNNTEGIFNVAIGSGSMVANNIGKFNTALGYSSLSRNTAGEGNVAVGYRSLYNNESGIYNVAIGYESLFNNTTGYDNVAIGFESLYYNTSGVRNTAFGKEALYSNSTGTNNFAAGYRSLYSNTIGLGNIGIGIYTLNKNTEGTSNIGLGGYALTNISTGSYNIAMGNESLNSNTAGSYNIALGRSAGSGNLGDYNVFIGTQAGANEAGSNKLYINNSGAAFPLIYGDFNTDILGFNAKVGIGTKTPELPLQVVTGTDVNLTDGSGQFIIGTEGAANLVMDNNEIQARSNGVVADLYLQNEGGNVRVAGAIVHASDRRLKRDIEDLTYGLQEVLKLEPQEYFWKGKEQENKSLGLIAQDVEAVIKNVVTYDAQTDRYGVSYTELIPVLIKAIQEQQEIIKAQEERYVIQNKSIESLTTRLEKLEHLTIAINQNE